MTGLANLLLLFIGYLFVRFLIGEWNCKAQVKQKMNEEANRMPRVPKGWPKHR